jgi:hypothetical protein
MAGKPNGSIIDADSNVGRNVTATPDVADGASGSDSGGTDGFINGFEVVDPGDAGTGNTDAGNAGVTKRRGRPPGSKNRTGSTGTKTPKNLASIEKMLYSIHLMGSKIVHPIIALDNDEAKQLSDAIQEVARHYPVGLTEKQLAWANLLMVAGSIYGTRVAAVMISNNKKPAAKTLQFPSAAQAVTGKPEPPKGPVTPSQIFGAAIGVNDEPVS